MASLSFIPNSCTLTIIITRQILQSNKKPDSFIFQGKNHTSYQILMEYQYEAKLRETWQAAEHHQKANTSKKKNGDGYPWNNPSKHLFFSLSHSKVKMSPFFNFMNLYIYIYIYTKPMSSWVTNQTFSHSKN